jgi:hypothetical protein
MSAFTNKLVEVCLGEFARWDEGAGRETHGTDDGTGARDYYLFVKEYWMSIGNTQLDGRTISSGIRPAWSSAFVSFCIGRAGAGAQFRYGEAHCHYIQKSMLAADGTASHGYVARRAETFVPRVGDIVCSGREYAKRFDYDQAKITYIADSFYPSHGDIVVEVEPDHVRVIGGNVNNNVDDKRLPLNPDGTLMRRTVGGTPAPWIAVLQCML